jgi:flavin-dependent dehydrogenase
LTRRYARVDRAKLKDKLLQQCADFGVQFHFGRARSCTHNDNGSALLCLDGTVIAATVIVDATGHARKLTAMDGEHNPGYQAAYGIMAGVRSHRCCDVL